MLHCNSVSHYRAFPRARCNTIQHTSTQAHTYPCNTNVYKNNSGHSIGLEYSVCLMFTKFIAGNLRATSTEMLIPDSAGNLHVTDGTLIENISQLTGKLTSMLIGIDLPDFVHDFEVWQSGELIQNAFPELSADAREFIKTGISPEEWDAMFAE